MPETRRLSVVIVSYECRPVLGECLASLRGALTAADEVIVVDNGSRDGTTEMLTSTFPEVRLLSNRENRGFAAAANMGVDLALGRLTLILNPDTRVPSDSIERLIGTLDGLQRDALIGPRLLETDEVTTQRSAFRFPTPIVLASEQLGIHRFRRSDAARFSGDEHLLPVDWLKGACLLAPTAMLRRYGPFDERFYMFSEDTDLCYRLHADRMPVLYVPDVSVVHVGGASTELDRPRMTAMFVESVYRYYQKNHSRRQLTVAVMTMRAIAAIKATRAMARWAWQSVWRDPNASHQRLEAGVFLKMIAVRPPPPGSVEGRVELDAGDGQIVEGAPAGQARDAAIDGSAAADPDADRPGEATAEDAEIALYRGVAQTAPVAKGSIALLTSFGVMAILNYAFAVTLSWLLPVEQYGAVGIGQAVLVTGATVIGASFPWALARALAQTRSRETQGRAFRAALVGNSMLGAGLSLFVAGIALAGIVQPREVYTPILLLAAASIAVLTPNAVFSGALQGLLLQRQLALVRVTEVVVKMMAGVVLVLIGFGAVGAIAGFLAGAIVATLLAAILLRGFPIGAGSGWTDRKLFLAAGPFFVAMVGFALLSQIDLLTLKAFAPTATADFLVGQYQVAVILGRIPFFAGLALFGAVFPHVSRSAGRSHEAHAYAGLAFKYTMLFLLPIGLTLAVVPDALIRLLFSSRYDASAEALAIVGVAMSILTLAYGCATLLQARGRHAAPAITLAIAVPLQVVLAAFAVPRLGMAGAAVALAFASAFVILILAPPVVRAYRLSASVGDGLRYAAALSVLAIALRLAPDSDRLTTVLGLAGSWILYGITLVLFRLLTVGDVETLGGAFGSRGVRIRQRIAGLVEIGPGVTRGPNKIADPGKVGPRPSETGDWWLLLPRRAGGPLLWIVAPGRGVPGRLAPGIEVLVADDVASPARGSGSATMTVIAPPSFGRPRRWRRDLDRLTEGIRPDGQLYLEIDRPALLARPRHTRRLLEQAGYSDVRAFWPVRGFADPEVFVPLTDRVAQRHYVSEIMWGGSAARRMVRPLLRVLIRLRMFDVAVPRYVVVATLESFNATTGPDEAGMLEAIADAWPAMTGADVRPPRIRWLVQAAGASRDGKVICSAWFGDSVVRDAVIKVARSLGEGSTIDREHQALTALRAYGDHASISVPRPLGCAVVRDRMVAAETAVPGRTLLSHMDDRPPSVATISRRFSTWVDWLSDLQARSRRPASRDDLETHLYQPMGLVVDELGLDRASAGVIERLARQADRLAARRPLDLVFTHNDLGPSNVLVSESGEPTGVIDWESAGPGLPATDLLYFIGRLADEIAEARHPNPGRDFHRSFVGRAGAPADGPDGLTRRWLDRYSSRLDLAAEWLPILFVSCWIHHARNEHRKSRTDQSATHDRAGFFRRRLEASLHMLDDVRLTSETR